MPATRILVTGALGQIGRVLIDHLLALEPGADLLATDLREPPRETPLPCAFARLDATDGAAWQRLREQRDFDEVYHLVAVLSATGERDPWWAWDLNMRSWRHVLESAAVWPACRVFFPSSIAAYGPPLPASVDESQTLHPTTVYGISKAAGEQWARYAYPKFGVDVRSLRLPGVIGYQTMPGGGTTDYAVDIFHRAVAGEPYTCFLAAGTRLPMIYMDDVLRGITELTRTPRQVLAEARPPHGDPVYNLAGFSVTPAELARAIREHVPNFAIDYAPDDRQAIAESWPERLDGTRAADDWGWQPRYDLTATTREMIAHLSPANAPA